MKKSIIIALALATTSSLTHAQEVERYDMFYASGVAGQAFISPSDGRAVISSLNYKSTSTNTATLNVRRLSIVTTVASNMNSSTNMILVVDNARNGTVDGYTLKANDHVIVYNTSANAVTWQFARVVAVLANQTNGQLRVQLNINISAAAGYKVYIAKSGDDVITTIPAASDSSTPVIATDLRYRVAGYKGMPLFVTSPSASNSAVSGVVEYWE